VLAFAAEMAVGLNAQFQEKIAATGSLSLKPQGLTILDSGRNLDREFLAIDRQVEWTAQSRDGEWHLDLGLGFACWLRPTTAARARGRTALIKGPATEEAPEQIGSRLGIHFDSARPAAPVELGAPRPAMRAAGSSLAEAIVLGTLGGIAQHVIGFLNFLELGFGFLVAGI